MHPSVLAGEIGKVGEQRVTLLTDIIWVDLDNSSEVDLEKELLKRVATGLKNGEIVAIDAGFKIKALFEAELDIFVLRLSKNFTARHNYLPEGALKICWLNPSPL